MEIIVKPFGGLCNRMRVIDSCVSITKDYDNIKVKILWEKHAELNCSFSDLFLPIEGLEIEEFDSFNSLVGKFKRLCFPNTYREKYGWVNKFFHFMAAIVYRFDKSVTQGFFSDLNKSANTQLGETIQAEKDFMNVCRPLIKELINNNDRIYVSTCLAFYRSDYYRAFIPIPSIRSEIENIIKRFQNTVGIHIRRTDHLESQDISTLEKFFGAMDELLKTDPTQEFFLATDEREVEEVLKNKFGKKILTYDKSSLRRDSKEGMIDAAIELYALSKTKKVLGSYGSSFSQVASIISNIDQIVVK